MVALREKGGYFFYLLARIIVGILFFLHGASTVFGFGGEPISLMGDLGLVGAVEMAIGLIAAIGMFSVLAYLAGAAWMAFSYFTAYLPKGINPLTNGGESTLLFFAAFAALLAYGSKHAEFDTTSIRKVFGL